MPLECALDSGEQVLFSKCLAQARGEQESFFIPAGYPS